MKKSDNGKALREAKSELDAGEAELETLRQQVQELEQAADAVEQKGGITKRNILQAAWVTPVVIAVNLPNSVFAQPLTSPGTCIQGPVAPGAPTCSPTPT